MKNFLKNLFRKIDYSLWFFFEPYKLEKINPNKIKNIIIINLGFIGDLLATTPMISALKKKFGQVDMLVRKGMEETIRLNSHIKEILTYQDDLNKDLQTLKKNNYDLAVIVWPASLKISKLCLKAGIPYRIGTTQTGLLEGKGYFLTRKVKPSWKTKHKVEENLDIAKLVDANIKNPKIEFHFSKNDESSINKLLNKGKTKKFIVIHPGKRGKFYAEYSWPLRNFSKLADYFIEKGFDIILTGSKSEYDIIEKIKKLAKNKNKLINLAGKLSLKEFGALLKMSELLISIDTAAVHIASAFDKKMLVINIKYPKVWHPWISKENYKLLKNPSIKSVIKSSEKLLVTKK